MPFRFFILMKRANTSKTKPIVETEGVVVNENLPLPIVHYPDFYGSFIGFQATPTDELKFCSCLKGALENYFEINSKRFKQRESFWANFKKPGIIDFPKKFLAQIKNKNIETSEQFLQTIRYKKAICHECNKKLPKYRYCHEYYGSTFKQNYGWYMYKQAYEYGVDKEGLPRLLDSCPQEIIDLAKITAEDLNCVMQLYREFLKTERLEAEFFLKEELAPLRKQKKQVMDYIENIVRDKFGHKKIGEAWVNETMLYYILSTLYPEKKILRHHRPKYLKGLEIDIYFPDDKVGIEYQGIQHFEPVKHWGGIEALKKVQERDSLKKKFCELNEIKLIYFLHSEVLSDELVQKKIKAHLG
ncbi:MAG: hypothetical protein GY755_19920 [Chloroflexi bacterium]|nr:hypothetical protein [Chloroflexota bacterium]